MELMTRIEPCLVGVEASCGAHHWVEKLSDLGHGADDESSVCAPLREVEQERLQRRGGDLRGGVSSDDAFRAVQDEGASGVAAGASEPRGDGGSRTRPVARLSGRYGRAASGSVGGDAGGARDRFGPGAGPAGLGRVHPDAGTWARLEREKENPLCERLRSTRGDGVDGAGGVGGQRQPSAAVVRCRLIWGWCLVSPLGVARSDREAALLIHGARAVLRTAHKGERTRSNVKRRRTPADGYSDALRC